ncbi:MAG: Trk system potassium transporter TrkA [Synergistaceae bacterium]|nr:Trk system potassium transporter TrkA [Synergistaceae bacterium]
MNIVIVGAGEVGRSVAKTLSSEGHNIYLVEKDEAQAKNADDELDVQVIRGNGARPQILAQAGVTPSGDVDLLIACTNRDEVNMLSCWIAHSAGVPYVISRARNLEFTDSADWGNKLGIDMMISPERSIAREIIGLLEVSSATHAAELLDGKAALYTLKISENSPLVNMALKDIRPKFPDLMAVFVHVEHEDGVSGVPNGFTELKAGDVCYVVTYKDSADLLQKVFQPEAETLTLRKLFIVGGGKLGTQIAQAVKRDFGNVSLRLIDIDPKRCARLAEELGEALVINSDGADKRVLSEEGIDEADGYICATDLDELNLIYCAIAKRMGAKKTIAIVKRKDYQEMTQCMPVDAIVDPNEALANLILRFVHYPKHTRAFSMIEKINAEMLEVVLPENIDLIGKTLAQIKLKKGVVVALLKRGDNVFVPFGSTQLLAGDRVILFALTEMMPEAAKLFGAELGEQS